MTPSPSACARSTKVRRIIWNSIQMTGRVQADAVVTPAVAAREFGDRHHLNRRQAERRQ